MSTAVSNPFRVEINSGIPSWITSAPLMTWTDVPNSIMGNLPNGQAYGIFAYSGAVMAGTRMLVHGGGHADYWGNEVLALDLAASSPTWDEIIPSSPYSAVVQDQHYYTDGRPASQHTYHHMAYSPTTNKVYMPRAGCFRTGVGNPPLPAPYVDHIDLNTNSFSSGTGNVGNTYPSFGYHADEAFEGQGWVMDSAERIWVFHVRNRMKLSRWDVATGTGVVLSTSNVPAAGEAAYVYDPTRNRIVCSYNMYSFSGHYYSLNGYVSGVPPVTGFTWAAGSSLTTRVNQAQMVYCNDRDSYLLLKHGEGTIHEIDPDTFATSVLSVSGSAPYTDSNCGRYYGKFAYIPQLKIMVLLGHHLYNMKFFRVA